MHLPSFHGFSFRVKASAIADDSQVFGDLPGSEIVAVEWKSLSIDGCSIALFESKVKL